MNNVQLSGRLTKDAELRVKPGDEPLSITRFTLAVQGVKKDEVNYIPCICFGKNAENIDKYIKKGDKIFITSGYIHTFSYENKKKETVYAWEVVVNGWEFGPAKKGSDAPAEAPEGLPFE